MTRTLLVAVELDDPSSLPELALEVQDILRDQGINVTSVKQWNPQVNAPTSLTDQTPPSNGGRI